VAATAWERGGDRGRRHPGASLGRWRRPGGFVWGRRDFLSSRVAVPVPSYGAASLGASREVDASMDADN
jgi:hypothetical protein